MGSFIKRLVVRRGVVRVIRTTTLIVALTAALVVSRTQYVAAGVVVVAAPEEKSSYALEAISVLGPLLEAKGFAMRPDSITRELGAAEPLSAHPDAQITAEELFKQIEAGYRMWLRGEFVTAEAQLSAVVDSMTRNPAVVVPNLAFRAAATRAYVGLAMSRRRLANVAGAAEAISELIRTLPEQPVTKGNFGAEAEKYYNEIRRSLDASPRGKLIIDVTNPDAQIFINEQGRARGETFKGDILPGTYRVMVQVAGTSRRFRVPVKPNSTVRLSVDWDAVSRMSVTSNGLELRISEYDMKHAPSLARRFLRAAESSRAVIVLAVEKRVMTGWLMSVESNHITRAGRINLGVDAGRRAQQLAQYLLGTSTSTPLVDMLSVEQEMANAPAIATAPGPAKATVPAVRESDKPKPAPLSTANGSTSPTSTSNLKKADASGRDALTERAGPEPDAKRAAQATKTTPASAATTTSEDEAQTEDESEETDADTATAPAARSTPLLIGAIASGVVGVATIGGGAYAISLNGQPIKSECPDPNVQCKSLYENTALGAGLIGGGVAALAVSGFLTYKWFGSGNPSERAVAVMPTAGGAYVAVGWRF